MTLADFVIQYREEHGLSGRAFAAKVGMSPQQISNIEKGIGNNGKPMTSTMKTYKKIAEGIGMSEQDFLNLLNDKVSLRPADDENMPIVEVDGHKMLDLTCLTEAQVSAISLVLQMDRQSLVTALPAIESLLSSQQVLDVPQ